MRLLITPLLLFSIAGPVIAGPCEEDASKIDAALAKDERLMPDVRQQVEDLRKQAEQLCKAGHEQEGLDAAAQAKNLLAIE